MTPRVDTPPLRQEQQAATRQRLIDAARVRFLEDGFVGTKVDRIVEQAGTSRATFYLHFKNKSDVMVAIWNERELPEVDARLRGFDALGDFRPAATRAWMSELVGYMDANSGVMMSAAQAMVLEPQLGASWVEGMRSAITEMPNLAAALGGDEAASDHILLLVLQLERTLYFWMHGALRFDRDRLVDALTRSWAIGD
jgi:AcrR family transcriptional regulator